MKIVTLILLCLCSGGYGAFLTGCTAKYINHGTRPNGNYQEFPAEIHPRMEGLKK